MTVKQQPKAKLSFRKKLARELIRQENLVDGARVKNAKNPQVNSMPRSTILLSVIVVGLALGWATGAIPFGIAYVRCGEAPITRRNEIRIGQVYYKPGSEGYGLASPIFGGGYVCQDDEEYKRVTPSYLR